MHSALGLRDYHLWAALLCGPMFWVALWLAGQPVQPVARVADTWPPYLLTILVYPVLEEIVFRGGVQGFLDERLQARPRWGVSPANFVTSLLFTLMHFIYHPPLWALGVFIPSLAFGYFRDRHQQLMTPIGLHVFYNAGYIILFVNF